MDSRCVNPEGMDGIVNNAIGILETAAATLKKNNRYNKNVAYQDYYPNGVGDHIRMIIEPIMRLEATGDLDKAVDTVAQSALHVSWLRAGAPKSKFAWLMQRYNNLFRVQERQIELRALCGDENDSNGNGFGTVSEVQRDG